MFSSEDSAGPTNSLIKRRSLDAAGKCMCYRNVDRVGGVAHLLYVVT